MGRKLYVGNLPYEVGETDVAPMRHPPDSAKAWRSKGLWRSRVALATAGAFDSFGLDRRLRVSAG